MTKIYIIGTDHNFQKGHGRYKEDARVFREYVREISALIQVKAIFEEMSKEALDKVGVETSACEPVAKELSLTHCLCDPDTATRERLGIQDENQIRREGFWNDWAPEEIEKKIFYVHRKREEIWLSCIENSGCDPVLFVCGANHVESISQLIGDRGLCSQVLVEDWAPNHSLDQSDANSE